MAPTVPPSDVLTSDYQRFESYEAYKQHMNSAHLRDWLKKYPDDPKHSNLYVEDWVFHDQDEGLAGGFERV